MLDFLTPTTAGLLMVAGGIPPLLVIYWIRNARQQPAVLWFQCAMASGMVWSLSFGLIALVDVPQFRFVLTNVLIFTIPAASICYFLFSYEFVFKKKPPRAVLLLFVPPALLFTFAWFNPEALIYTMEEPHLTDEILIPANPGSIRPLVTVGMGYSLVIMSAGMVFGELLRTTQRNRKRHAAVILFSTVTVSCLAALKVLGLVPSYFDPTPIGWTLSGLLFVVSIHRDGFLQRLPASREHIMTTIPAAVVVLNSAGVVADHNDAARQLFSVDAGMHRDELKRATPELAPVVDEPETATVEIETADRTRFFDAQSSALEYGHREEGTIIVLREITERKAAEQDLEATKERYRRLFQNSSDYVAIIDESETVCDITLGVENVLGYAPDDVIGRNVFDDIHPADEKQAKAAFADVVSNPERELNAEFRVRTADGSYRWIEGRGSNHLDDPLIDGVIANIRDISERKEREEELEALTTRLQLALKETDTGVWVWDPETDEVVWDEASERLFGYKPGTFPGRWEGFARHVPDDDLAVVEQAATEAIETDQQYQADYRIELPNGEQRWIQGRGIVEYDADGEPERLLGIHTDITDRKEAERAVEETKEYYRRLFQQSSDFVLVVDEDGTINDVTQGVEHVLGHEPDELIGTDAFTYVHPDDRDRLASSMDQNMRNPEGTVDVEYRSQASDGSYRWLEAKGSNHIDDPLLDGLVANVRDISERKEREQELEALTTRLELALEETHTGVWEWDPDTDEVVWDEACERLFGYEPGEFQGTYEAVAEHLSADHLAAFEQAVGEAIDSGRSFQSDFSIDRPDGDRRWIQARGIVEYDDGGSVDRLLGIKTDITEQKEAQQTVEETKQYYRRIFQQSSDFVLLIDPSGTITDLTAGVTDVVGYEPDAAIGTPVFSYIHPDDRETVRQLFEDALENPGAELQVECRARTTDGSYCWVDARGNNHLDDPLLEGVMVTVRDITHQKQYEQKLARTTARLQRKNEQLERLAQIVSHDLQTPLSTAEKLTGLLRADLGAVDPAVEQSLEDLETTHQRLREFADHLPRLARESTGVGKATICDLQTIAEAAWSVVETGVLDLQIESTCRLSGDPSRLQRVFENLFQNTVTHGVEAVDSDQSYTATTVRVGATDNGFYIADDGPGIRPEQRDELFEYGMSTGSGSGFGLAIVRTITEAHGWTIGAVDSNTGGARFEVDTTQ